jgi:hypothetical protein
MTKRIHHALVPLRDLGAACAGVRAPRPTSELERALTSWPVQSAVMPWNKSGMIGSRLWARLRARPCECRAPRSPVGIRIHICPQRSAPHHSRARCSTAERTRHGCDFASVDFAHASQAQVNYAAYPVPTCNMPHATCTSRKCNHYRTSSARQRLKHTPKEKLTSAQLRRKLLERLAVHSTRARPHVTNAGRLAPALGARAVPIRPAPSMRARAAWSDYARSGRGVLVTQRLVRCEYEGRQTNPP